MGTYGMGSNGGECSETGSYGGDVMGGGAMDSGPSAGFQLVAATLGAYTTAIAPFQLARLLSSRWLYALGLAFHLGSCVSSYLYLLLDTSVGHRAASAVRGRESGRHRAAQRHRRRAPDRAPSLTTPPH